MEAQKEKIKTKPKRAVFLDRDGVVNRAIVRGGKPYPPWSLDEFKILPNVMEACATLKQAGYALVIATNQPDVGRGTLSRNIVEAMHSLIREELPINRIEVCYHPGEKLSDCDCRKPLPVMLIRAATELDLDLKQSWMIGDRFSDIECGHAAGCRTILIGNGYNEAVRISPDFRAENLLEAVTIILN